MKYIFPNSIANAMAKVTMRTQLEASLLSMFFIMIGVILSAVYVFLYTNFAIWFKIVTGVNGFFGIVFLGSFLVTTFQQYLTVIDVEEQHKKEEEERSDSNNKKEVK